MAPIPVTFSPVPVQQGNVLTIVFDIEALGELPWEGTITWTLDNGQTLAVPISVQNDGDASQTRPVPANATGAIMSDDNGQGFEDVAISVST